MDNIVSQQCHFAILCGGRKQEAVLLKHLFDEAYDRVGEYGMYHGQIKLRYLSNKLDISENYLSDLFISLGDWSELIYYDMVWVKDADSDVKELVGMKYVVCPSVIKHKISLLSEESNKVKKHNARAIDLHVPATLTIEDWISRLDLFHWRCAYCGGNYDVLEHIIPLTFHDSGTVISNCVPACSKCNVTKGPFHPDRFPSNVQRSIGEKVYKVRCLIASLSGSVVFPPSPGGMVKFRNQRESYSVRYPNWTTARLNGEVSAINYYQLPPRVKGKYLRDNLLRRDRLDQ